MNLFSKSLKGEKLNLSDQDSTILPKNKNKGSCSIHLGFFFETTLNHLKMRNIELFSIHFTKFLIQSTRIDYKDDHSKPD